MNTYLYTIKVSGMKEEEDNTYLYTIKVSGMKEEEVNTYLNTYLNTIKIWGNILLSHMYYSVTYREKFFNNIFLIGIKLK